VPPTLLEVGAPAAADQQRVAREHPAGGRQVVAHAAVRVPGRGAALQLEAAEADGVAVLHVHVGLGARGAGDHRLEGRHARLCGAGAGAGAG
jgi:hypothetical protein